MERCEWCGTDPLYVDYHDTQWGVPVHDDSLLYEMLLLEGAQAGLSWLTILRKRENYRKAFDGFQVDKIASYTNGDMERLMGDAGIVRNRLKIASAITNAQKFIEIRETFGSFNDYIWKFVDGQMIRNHWPTIKDIPANTPQSDKISRDLKQRGFKFIGTTIIYSFMQSVGMVNDHRVGCFRYEQVNAMAG